MLQKRNFTHKGKVVVDPWIDLETHYDGKPWSFHNNPEYFVNPFEYYGYEKTAGFIEEILMKHEDANEEGEIRRLCL